jgi:hypothetical protein
MASVNCLECSGEGSKTCPDCEGAGKVGGLIGLLKKKCAHCKGAGSVPCVACEGSGKKELEHHQFEFPDGHTSIFRTHDAANDKWPECDLEFTNSTFRVTITSGDDYVSLWDAMLYDVPVDAYRPGRFSDWEHRPDYCECSACNSDQEGKLRIELFKLGMPVDLMKDDEWLAAVEQVIPAPLGYWLFERTFQRQRQGGIKLLFVVANSSDVELVDGSKLDGPLSQSVAEVKERGKLRNIESSQLDEAFGKLDELERALIGCREPVVSQVI